MSNTSFNPKTLSPPLVWEYFYALTQIPRPSGHEKAAQDFIHRWALEHTLEAKQDAAGNIVVYVPKKGDGVSDEPLILQGHLDMVPTKTDDSAHEFTTDPIAPRVIDGHVYATNTTLGADNGIGVAMSMAAATDPDIAHPPLELLFTFGEEVGMDGAKNLDASLLSGRRMLNLDTEEENCIYIGCAGGNDITYTLPVMRSMAPAETNLFTITLSGYTGGHSGADIHLTSKGNALHGLVYLLDAINDMDKLFRISSLSGGNVRNAIPKVATAMVATGQNADQLKATISKRLQSLQNQFGQDLVVDIAPTNANHGLGFDTPLDTTSSNRLLQGVLALPTGVFSMSEKLPDLVETSNNVAIIETTKDKVDIKCMARSSSADALNYYNQKMLAVGVLMQAKVKISQHYPGWDPNPASPLLATAKQVHQKVTGKKAGVLAIHAGLECGILTEKLPGLDVISMGPEIKDAHTPREHVSIVSVERTWKFMSKLLAAL